MDNTGKPYGRSKAARFAFGLVPLAFAMMISACVAPETGAGAGKAYFIDPSASYTPPADLPDMRWHRRAEADSWTAEALQAVAEKDAVLTAKVPADIAQWCPGYKSADADDRRAFWVGLMSAVAKHESSWNPAAAGGGGRYIGLMQISPRTAAQHGCDANSAGALKNGGDNLTCAVEIFAEQVGADGVVAGNGSRGIGRDWGPFRNASKRAEMSAWTSAQPFCKAG